MFSLGPAILHPSGLSGRSLASAGTKGMHPDEPQYNWQEKTTLRWDGFLFGWRIGQCHKDTSQSQHVEQHNRHIHHRLVFNYWLKENKQNLKYFKLVHSCVPTDNGGSFRMSGSNWPLRGEKNSLFEGGMKAVGFVTSPLLPANELNRNLLHVVDWYPTIAALAGDTNVSRLDGFNIWESLR